MPLIKRATGRMIFIAFLFGASAFGAVPKTNTSNQYRHPAMNVHIYRDKNSASNVGCEDLMPGEEMYTDVMPAAKKKFCSDSQKLASDFPNVTINKINELFFNINSGSQENFLISHLTPKQQPASTPDAPIPLTVLNGHWKSSNHTTTRYLEAFLDLTINDNGEFSGLFSAYECIYDPIEVMWWHCRWDESMRSEPASGTINFNRNYGKITFEDCKNIPFTIVHKSHGKLTLQIHTTNLCGDLDHDINVVLHHESDSEISTDSTKTNSNSDVGEGSGCFLKTIDLLEN